MIVVAVIAILAAIAIPAWNDSSAKSKARSEVNSFLAEIAAKEEQYHQDNGVYLDTSASACPSTTTAAGSGNVTTCFNSGTWASLRINPPEQYAYCSYYVKTGSAATNPAPPIGTLNTSPATTWYYVLATCDMDNNTSVNSQYLTSNLDTTIQKANEGH